MSTPAQNEAAFRRSRRIALACLVWALPLALWVAAGEDWTDYRARDRQDVVSAPAGAAVSYAGSDWQLDALEPLAGAADGRARLRVRVAVTARDADAVKNLARCSLMLVGDDGKRWSGAGANGFAANALPSRCDGDYATHPEPGKAMRFEQIFTVPAAEAERVEPELVVEKEKPRVLRLRRR